MATFTERLELLVTGKSTDAVQALNKTSDATDNLTKKQKAMSLVSGGASDALGALGVSAGMSGAAMATAGAGAAALVGVKVAQWAKGAADEWAGLAGEIRDFQRVSGASAEDASAWVAVLDDMGLSAETGGKAVFKLGREVASGGDALAEFGVEVAKNEDGTTDLTGTLLNVADAYAATTDPAKRAELAVAAFGKAGKDLAPILERGRAGLKEFFEGAEGDHQIFSQADLETAREYDLAMDSLGDSLRGLKLEAGAAAAPAITKLADTLTAGVHAFDFAANAAGGFGGKVAGAGLKSVPLFGTLISITDGLSGIADAFGLGGEASTTYADQQNKVKDALQKVLDLQAAGKGGTAEYAAAVRDASAAQNEVEASTRKATQALTDNAIAQYQSQQGYLAQAQAGVGLTTALLNVNDALDKEAQLLAAGQAENQTAQQYTNDLAQAHVGVQNAVIAAMGAASAKAVADAGPNASASDKAAAATKAQNDAIIALYNSTPATKQALDDLGYTVRTLPDGKQIVISTNAAEIEANIRRIKDLINSADWKSVGAPSWLRSAPAPAAASVNGAVAAPAAMVRGGAPGQVVALTVNVSTTGLGASSPEIQRAVVDAVRGYVARNGRLENIAR